MVDFEDSVQANISCHDDTTAQFRFLWTIKEYEKVKQSVKHPNCIKMKLPVNILPRKFICELWLYPNGDARVTECNFTSLFICNKQKRSIAWVSYNLALLDGTSNEQYAAKPKGSRKFDAAEGTWGYDRMFPANTSEAQAKILFPNGCLQILMKGMVWAKEPTDKTADISQFKDCSIMSSVTLNQTERYSDAALSVGKGQFQVHKNILSSKSSVFQEIFENSSQNIIVIPDVREEVFREVVNFIYTDTVTAKFDTMLPEVLTAAKKYKLNYLVEVCQVKMIKNLNASNCLQYLEIADICNASQLKEGTLEYITQNRKVVFTRDAWKDFKTKSKDLHWELLERCMNLD